MKCHCGPCDNEATSDRIYGEYYCDLCMKLLYLMDEEELERE